MRRTSHEVPSIRAIGAIRAIGVIGVIRAIRAIGVIGGIRAIGVIGVIGVIGEDRSYQSDRRERPLAVGRIVAPSRRGNAPNDCGVRSHTKQATSPVWEVGLGRYPLSSPTHKGSISHLVHPSIGRSGP